LAFLGGHASFWFCCHLVSVLQFQSFWLNHALMIYWLTVAGWNGSCYYMDYFARKYEMQLMQLMQLSAMEKGVAEVSDEQKKEQ
jgi:hypothetical protein